MSSLADPLILVGHGTRDAKGRREFQELLKLIAASHPGIVECGFLEFESPDIQTAINRALLRARNEKSQGLVVLPVQLLGARHVQVDIQNAVETARRRHPDLPIYVGKSLEQHETITTLCRIRCEAALVRSLAPLRRKEIALVVVGRGTSDPHNRVVVQMAQTLQKELGLGWASGCYAGLALPQLTETLNVAYGASLRTILVLPFFLFTGHMVQKVHEDVERFRETHPDCQILLAGHLGPDPLLRDALLDRYEKALRVLG